MKGDISITTQGDIELRTKNLVEVPCLTCELRRLCEPGGAISP